MLSKLLETSGPAVTIPVYNVPSWVNLHQFAVGVSLFAWMCAGALSGAALYSLYDRGPTWYNALGLIVSFAGCMMLWNIY